MELFKVFQNRDEYFELLSQGKYSKNFLLKQIGIILLFAFIYGVVMGSYNSFLQSIVTGVKVPVLITLALLICFPALYVIQYILGSKMGLVQMIIMILSGFLMFSSILVSFAPIVLFFMITGNDYNFLKLLHVAIFTFSGIFGMRIILEALKFSCEKKNIYPKIGLNIFKFWIFVFAFVGMQLAWNLRPFLGDKNEEFELFREREGNFYKAVVFSAANMFSYDKNAKNSRKHKNIEFKKNAAIDENDLINNTDSVSYE
jgi:hypothetical protein